jgi:enoyl-CoA hydratase/carnithine racemase
VVKLRLDRPERRNALSTAMVAELRDHLVTLDARAVILCAAGDVFCAGADTQEEPSVQRIRLVSEVLTRLRELEAPTIAAVHGPAIGAGWGLALACDLCFCSAAARFSLPEVAKGYRIPGVLMARLSQVIGPVRAAEVVLAGTPYGPEEAVAAGCVTRVFAGPEALEASAWELARALAGRARRELIWTEDPLVH